MPIEARSEHIELVEDLVLGGATDDPQQAFFGLGGAAVGTDGRVYVLDSDAADQRMHIFVFFSHSMMVMELLQIAITRTCFTLDKL